MRTISATAAACQVKLPVCHIWFLHDANATETAWANQQWWTYASSTAICLCSFTHTLCTPHHWSVLHRDHTITMRQHMLHYRLLQQCEQSHDYGSINSRLLMGPVSHGWAYVQSQLGVIGTQCVCARVHVCVCVCVCVCRWPYNVISIG